MPLRSFLAKALRASHRAKNTGTAGRQDEQSRGKDASKLDPKFSQDPSPLLDLPVELRLLMYSYLIPNITVEIAAQPLRSDSSPVCLALLRLNRQIYIEAREQWYGSNIYKARIVGNGLEIYGRRLYYQYPSTPQFLQTFDVLKTLKYIRVLDLSIFLRPSYMNEEKWKQLAKCFPPKDYALEKLVLGVEVSMGICYIPSAAYGKLTESGLRRNIELVLKPLRGISGLKEVRVRDINAASGKCPGDVVLDLVRRVFPIMVAEIFQMD